MNIPIYISEQTIKRFMAARKYLGYNEIKSKHSRELDEAITSLLNSYFEESGCPADLNGDPIQDSSHRIEFVYNKVDGSVPKWRAVDVIEESDLYIKGYENGEYKCFSKDKIVGGKIIQFS